MIKKLLVPSFVLSAVVLFCSFTNNLVSAAATSTVSDQSGFPVIDVNELPPPSGNPPGTEALDNIATTTKFTTPKASPIYISNFELDKDVYNSGDNVSGTITLFNSQGVDQLDVYINVSLAGQYSKEPGQYNIPQVVYDTKSFGPFTVKTNTFTKIPLPYTLPTAVGGKNLGVNVQTRMVSGLPIGGSKTVFLKEVIGGLKLLSIKEAYTTIGDGKKYSPQLGHVLNATSSDSFHVVLTNSSTETITVTPNVEIHNLISSNPTIKKYTTDQIAIAPKGTYEFITSPYKEGLSSGVYVAGITFLDDKNISRAPPVEFRYILPGDVAVIQGLQFDNKSVKKDEVIHANVIFGGVNYDPTTGAQNPIANATLNLKVYDGNSDQVIGYGSSTLNFDKGAGSVLLPITINKDASTIRVESTIEKDGKTIAANTSSVTTPTDTEVQNRSDGYFWWLLLVVLSAISFVFVLLTIVSRRSTNKVTLGLFFLAIIASTGFIAKNAESEAYLWWNTTTSYAYLDYTTFSQPNTKPWLTLGDPVYVNGVVTNWTAVGAGQLINVYANLSNASYTPVTAQQVWSTGARYSWGTNWDAFGFKFTGPSKVGAYYADVRVYDWQPFYGYESDQRYRVPFYVYNPVNVTCSADKTVVKIGETVNWTMTTSGGTGSYRYYWYNPTDQTNYTNSPQVTTLSKTYTTKGTKNMFAAIVDNYTKNNSNSNNGGWKQCSNTVTVTDPITVSCTADKATPNVGEVVNWNATASGGTGQYTYVWQDPENFSAVSATSSTLTKTYSSIGTKSVSVMVYDKAITGIVPTSQGVSAVCSTTVSLTCTAPQVLNGAGTACVTPLTCTAPQIMNPAGTACVTPLTCTAPQVLNGAGTACVTPLTCTAPQELNPAGTACVTPLTCTAPQVLNGAGTACVTPPALSDPAPEPIIARIPDKIIITFDKPLDPASVPPTSSFPVIIGDPVTNPTTVPVIAVEIVGPVLTLTTGTPVTGVNALSFTYVPPSSGSPLQGLAGSDVSTFNLNFKDTDVININHTNTPPVSIVSFGVRPNIVNKNTSCNMYLKVDNAHSCRLSGTDGANLNITLYNEGNASTTLNTGPIQETTRFTLTCNGREEDNDGNYGPTVTKTATCSLNPSRTDF